MKARIVLGVVAVAAGTLALGVLAGGESDSSNDGGSALAAGVGPVNPEPSSDPEAPSGQQTARPRPKVSDYYILPEQLEGWLSAAAPRERAAIEDGILTFEEYEVAVLSTLACIEDAGIRVTSSTGYGRAADPQDGPRLSSRGEYSYGGTVPGTPDLPPAAAKAAFNACKAGSAQIEFLWAQHLAPSEVELQAMRDHMAACLRTLGVQLPERPSDRELASSGAVVGRAAYRECQFKAADAFEIDRLPG